MKSQQDRAAAQRAVQTSLLDMVRSRVAAHPEAADDPDQLLQESLASVVASFLSSEGTCAAERLEPADVGAAYEYLRGFELVFDRQRIPRLQPSQSGKRNQGTFYTPPEIVTHIVTHTLESLPIEDGKDFLSVKVLDPAVGTGAFLAETLEQITARILQANDRAARSQVIQPIDLFRGRMRAQGSHAPFDEQTAVKIAVLENCLYGVDLDASAVAIARALLVRQTFGEHPVPPDLKLNLRVGNALIGTPRGNPDTMSRDAEDRSHACVYLGKQVGPESASAWARERAPIHWPLEFPEVFRERGGFDAVVGNPPYEIVSVKESGIGERSKEQAYFRKVFRGCHGKINTYRLMMERGLDLLRDGGALGFIVPATLLADSTAEKLRSMLLDQARITETVIIPEKARVFDRVTQALAIMIAVKGEPTEVVAPIWWDTAVPAATRADIIITREDIHRARGRIPVLRSPSEKKLLDLLNRFPPFGGGGDIAPAGKVHQGEVNLTVHRDYITSEPTQHPLVRGEHVFPFRLVHPSQREGRLDWVKGAFFEQAAGSGERGRPWERPRIVLGRVVNMATHRRLKAAEAPAGVLLGDMTNFINDLTLPLPYLLGLLNSALLNWRMKVTSTNNYISAAEIENLPIPRNWTRKGGLGPIESSDTKRDSGRRNSNACVGADPGSSPGQAPCVCPLLGAHAGAPLQEHGTISNAVAYENYLDEIDSRRCNTVAEDLEVVRSVLQTGAYGYQNEFVPVVIGQLTLRMLCDCRESGGAPETSRQKLLDALVLELFGAGEFAGMIEGK